jgi:hypothetical protein
MWIFDRVRRMFAQATEEGIKDGLRNSGFVPASEAEGSHTLALWLTNGTVEALPPHEGEKGPKNAEFTVWTNGGAMKIVAESQEEAEAVAAKDGHTVKAASKKGRAAK